jgi:hypothetical protein
MLYLNLEGQNKIYTKKRKREKEREKKNCLFCADIRKKRESCKKIFVAPSINTFFDNYI